jgi:hypothetical protein
MPEQSVIVWDLETVLDLSTATRMLDLGDAKSSVTICELSTVILKGFLLDRLRSYHLWQLYNKEPKFHRTGASS